MFRALINLIVVVSMVLSIIVADAHVEKGEMVNIEVMSHGYIFKSAVYMSDDELIFVTHGAIKSKGIIALDSEESVDAEEYLPLLAEKHGKEKAAVLSCFSTRQVAQDNEVIRDVIENDDINFIIPIPGYGFMACATNLYSWKKEIIGKACYWTQYNLGQNHAISLGVLELCSLLR